MEYHFKRQDVLLDPVIFALFLDHKGGKERILIGAELEIETALRGANSNIYYDRTRPLGTLLADFQQDTDDQWMEQGFTPLWNALHTNRFHQPDLEHTSTEYLTRQYQSENPLSMYAAIRLWNGYLRARLPRNRDLAAEGFRADLMRLLPMFHSFTPKALRSRSFMDDARISETSLKLDIWYPRIAGMEFVTGYASFLPIFLYYHNRLKEWGLYFRECKVCGRPFLAKSQKYGICSDTCRKLQNRQNKRNFDARAKENNYDRIYKNECQHWRNLIHKAEKTPDFPQERLSAMKSAFEDFKKEALVKKAEVKNGGLDFGEFEGWILRSIDGFTDR